MGARTIDVDKAWEELKWESLVNKPTVAPNSDSVVKAREYLLIAQVLLAKYETELIFEKQEELADAFNKAMTEYRKQMHQTRN